MDETVQDEAAAADEPRPSLEAALARTEADVDAALRAAATATKAAKRLRGAAHVGNLRELRPALEAAEQATAELSRRLAETRAGWDFDEEAYFGSGRYPREVVEAARERGLRIFEEDDRLYCYPLLVRVLAGDRAVLIDKARERRLRPSVLVDLLAELQRRPQRFRSDAFLETLFDAYEILVARQPRGGQNAGFGRIERLTEIYGLLTLLPGSARDYSRQEFGRDLYLLDQSGVSETRRGYRLGFHASTGTRSGGSGTIRVITESGQDKVYYGISFSEPGR